MIFRSAKAWMYRSSVSHCYRALDCEVTTMRHIAHCFCTFVSFCIVTAAVLASSQLSALELNQAIESCRAPSGKPAYLACKQSGGTHEVCFGKARSIVQSCV